VDTMYIAVYLRPLTHNFYRAAWNADMV